MQNIYQAKGATLREQYFDVGRLFADSIQKSVAAIGKKRSRLTNTRREVAERTWINIQNKAAAQEFVQCLTSWSEGAGITVNQAMWALADNLTGCQTMMVRYATGIALLHSEEEFHDAKHIELHMSGEHTIEFDVQGELSRSLVYNDLIPGAGLYGWKKDMIVAVDSLFLREDGIEKVQSPLLANIVSWMVWRMSPEEASPERVVELIKELGELIDGYAINVVRKVGDRIEGYKLTLARSEYRVKYLGEKMGSHLRQVNIIDPLYPRLKWALPPKKIWRGGWQYFINRLKVMDQHAKKFAKYTTYSLDVLKLDEVHAQIQKTIFGELREAYINPDVGAICVGLVDQNGTSVSTKLNDEKKIEMVEYLDIL